MNKQKIRFLSNTWLDIINISPGFVLILILSFFEIFWPVKCLTTESPTMITLFFVDTDLEFDLFMVVICSDSYVELVFFIISFVYIIWYPNIWERRILNDNWWRVAKRFEQTTITIIFCLFLSSERRIEFSFSRNTNLVSRTLVVWLFFDSLLSFLSLSDRSNDISFLAHKFHSLRLTSLPSYVV